MKKEKTINLKKGDTLSLKRNYAFGKVGYETVTVVMIKGHYALLDNGLEIPKVYFQQKPNFLFNI